jgi:hypothetical protein
MNWSRKVRQKILVVKHIPKCNWWKRIVTTQQMNTLVGVEGCLFYCSDFLYKGLFIQHVHYENILDSTSGKNILTFPLSIGVSPSTVCACGDLWNKRKQLLRSISHVRTSIQMGIGTIPVETRLRVHVRDWPLGVPDGVGVRRTGINRIQWPEFEARTDKDGTQRSLLYGITLTWIGIFR